MNRFVNYWSLIVVSLMILAVAVPVAAQAKDEASRYTIAPYALFPAMDGTLGIRGIEVDTNASIGDILSSLQFGFNGYFAARKGNWGFGVDVLYMSLGTSTDRVNIDPSQAAFTFLAIRRLAPNLDLQFGACWNVLRGRLEFKDNSVVLAGTVLEEAKQWADPLWASTGSSRWGSAGCSACPSTSAAAGGSCT